MYVTYPIVKDRKKKIPNDGSGNEGGDDMAAITIDQATPSKCY
jgi:hypothetical protein